MRPLSFIAAALGGIFLIVFLVCVILRIAYPYPLWVLEDEIFHHAFRLSQGHEIYVSWDSLDVPLIYPPLFYALGALLLKAGGELQSLRLISLVSIIATYAVAVLFLRRAKVSTPLIICALGFLSAISPLVGGSWEQAKVDGLMIALVLWGGYYLSSDGRSIRHVVAAAVLLALSFFAKQNAAPFILAALAYAFFCKRMSFRVFILSFAASFLAIGAAAYIWTGEHLLFYIWTVPSKQSIYPANILADILPLWLNKFPIIIILSLSAFWLHAKGDKKLSPLILLYYLPAAFLAYALPRCKYAGYTFNLLPFLVVAAILAGWMLFSLPSRHDIGKKKAGILVLLLLIVQYILLAYNPARLLPNDGNRQLSIKAVSEIARLDGEVYVPIRSYFAHKAGKNVYTSYVAIQDVLSTGLKSEFPRDLINALSSGEIKYILIPEESRLTLHELPDDLESRLIYKGYIIDPEKFKANPKILAPPLCLYEILPQPQSRSANQRGSSAPDDP